MAPLKGHAIDPFVPLENTNALLLAPVAALAYFDTRSVDLDHPMSPLEAWAIMTEKPLPLLPTAFRIRDAISSVFGVAPIGGFSGVTPAHVEVGQKLDFFLVEHLSPEALCLTARDRHLDVLTCVSAQECRLTVTSSVITHNRFGQMYMLPVGPAHKLIVNVLLKRLEKAA